MLTPTKSTGGALLLHVAGGASAPSVRAVRAGLLATTSSSRDACFREQDGLTYVREDRGDTWQTVSNNLPPIYSVRLPT